MKNTFKITVVSSAFSFLPVVFYIIDPSLLSILLSQVVTAVFVLIFSLAFVKREWFGRISYSHKIFKKIISYSGILYFAGVFWIAGSKSFSFFLNYFSGIVQVSFFSVAFGLYTIMTYLQDSLSTGMFPIISRLGKNNKMSIINSFSRVYAMIYAPVIVAFLFYSDFLIPLIFSARYAGAVPVFQVLCITNLVVIFSIVLTPLSYACGREKFGFYSNLLALAVSVFSSFMLVPRFNAVGAAYSFLTTMAAMISLWWVLFLREFKDVKFPFSAVRIIIVSLGVGFLAYFATSSVHLLFPFIFIPLCYWFLRITKACDDKDLELLLKGLKIFLNLR